MIKKRPFYGLFLFIAFSLLLYILISIAYLYDYALFCLNIRILREILRLNVRYNFVLSENLLPLNLISLPLSRGVFCGLDVVFVQHVVCQVLNTKRKT